MNEATVKLIEELAKKLGITAEHLWAVLVKQAPIDGICSILEMTAMFFILYWTFKLVQTKTKEPTIGYAEWYCEGALVAWLLWAALAIIIVGATCVNFPNIVASFVNPEYWALRQIISP